MSDRLRAAIRDVSDFPKKGIMFKDITPVLGDPELLRFSIDAMANTVSGIQIDKVAGIDARGFFFAPSIALHHRVGVVPIRKKGKLPWNTKSVTYSLEYGENVLEIHADAVKPGDRVLLVDDLLATGGTACAAVNLLQQLGAEVVCATFLIELDSLNGRNTLNCDTIHSILHY